jgi:diphthamide synthase (EF-2-diphthine--ammonia ligase)
MSVLNGASISTTSANNALVSWSGGKDSCLAFYRAKAAGRPLLIDEPIIDIRRKQSETLSI